MSIRNKNFGLPGIIDGTTASEAELQDDARRAVMKKLGVTSWAQPSMKAPLDQDQETDLYVEIPIKKEISIVEVKDQHGFTPKQNREIEKYLTRPPPTEDQKEAAAFWRAYNDPSSKKMVSHIKNMDKKYSGTDEEPPKAAPINKNNKGFKYESWADGIAAKEKLANKANTKTVKQLTDLKNWSNNSKKV